MVPLMITWLSDNYLTLLAGAVVLCLVLLSLRNILPRKGHPSGCGSCQGCSGSCSCCSSRAAEELAGLLDNKTN